jgi:hypothetical protein
MRMATVVEPTSVQRPSKRRDFAPEPDEDAETLVFDLAAREPDEWLVEIAEGATHPRVRSRPTAFRPSDAQIAMTMLAVLIGAMAAAWSIEQRAFDAVASPEALVGSLAKVWYEATGARVGAARPQPSKPAGVASAAAATTTVAATTATVAPTVAVAVA